jgi:hypothetical protein
VARGNARGAQFSNIASIARQGTFRGGQFSSVLNVADTGIGMQAAVVNVAKSWKGFQASVVNVGSFNGAQCGVVDVADSGHGAQIGVVDIAHSLRGLQLGVVNAAGSAHGTQFGVVNVADTLHGIQFGVVNFSHVTDGLPIGLVSWSSTLPLRTDAWMDENGLPTLSFVWEWKWLHSQTDISCDAGIREHPVFGYGMSFGAQLPSRRWILSADIGSKSITRGESHRITASDGSDQRQFYNNQLLRARLLAGVWALPRVGIFAGTGWTLLQTSEARDDEALVTPMHGIPDRTWTDGLRAWPSLFAGVRLSLRN